MRSLIGSTFVTLDGVISSPEQWGSPYWDEEHQRYGSQLLSRADALLLGRETYEGFAAVWPQMDDDDYARRINALPKHVASRTLTGDQPWNATVLDGDIADAVRALKESDGHAILKFGTGELDRTLLEAGLLDELHLWVFPALAGAGDRLLDGIGAT
ncbi:MAG: dihydrofolate reductase family protein, partial [Phycicoccus sp.]